MMLYRSYIYINILTLFVIANKMAKGLRALTLTYCFEGLAEKSGGKGI